MSATLDYLIGWVNARLDEMLPEGVAVEGAVPNMEQELNQAALFVLRKAPKQLVYPAAKKIAESTGEVPGKDSLVVLQDKEAGLTSISCPGDYLRFLRLHLEGWKRPVDQLASVDDGRYRQRSNRFYNGNPYKPTAALVPDSTTNGHTAIEAMPGGKVLSLIYVPSRPAADMPEILHDPMVWMTAARAFTILREPNLSKVAMSNMQLAMDQLLIGLQGEERPIAPANARRQ